MQAFHLSSVNFNDFNSFFMQIINYFIIAQDGATKDLSPDAAHQKNRKEGNAEQHSAMEMISTPKSQPSVTPTSIISEKPTLDSFSSQENEQSKLTPPPNEQDSFKTTTPPVDESQAKKNNNSLEKDDSTNCFTSPSGTVLCFGCMISIKSNSRNIDEH